MAVLIIHGIDDKMCVYVFPVFMRDDQHLKPFSYDLIDGRRTYVCHFIGTLEEPYKQSGFIEYYVYSEGWDIWFEAYST